MKLVDLTHDSSGIGKPKNQLKKQALNLRSAKMDQIFTQLAYTTVTMVGKAAMGYAAKQASTVAVKHISTRLSGGGGIKQSGPLLLLAPSAEDKSRIDVATLRKSVEWKSKCLLSAVELIAASSGVDASVADEMRSLAASLRAQMDKVALQESSVDALTDKLNLTRIDASPDFLDGSGIDSLNIVKADLEWILEQINEAMPFVQIQLQILSMTSTTSVTPSVPSIEPTDINSVLRASGDIAHDLADKDIGSPLTVKVFTLFTASVRTKSTVHWSWKEKSPLSTLTFSRDHNQYSITVLENFEDDGRFHDDDDEPQVTRIDVKDIEKIFYASSEKLLRIDDNDEPCLVIKYSESHAGVNEFGDSKTPVKQKPIHTSTSLSGSNYIAFHLQSKSVGSSLSDNNEDSDNEKEVIQEQDPRLLKWLEYAIRISAFEELHDGQSHLEAYDEKLYNWLSSSDKKDSDLSAKQDSQLQPVDIDLRRQEQDTSPSRLTRSRTPIRKQ